jgi:hypothetical protein
MDDEEARPANWVSLPHSLKASASGALASNRLTPAPDERRERATGHSLDALMQQQRRAKRGCPSKP